MSIALASLSPRLSPHPAAEMQSEEVIHYRWLKTPKAWKSAVGKPVFRDVNFYKFKMELLCL